MPRPCSRTHPTPTSRGRRPGTRIGRLPMPSASSGWSRLRIGVPLGDPLSRDGEAVSAVELGLDDETTGSVHFALAEELWNQGIMTEAVCAGLRWGFDSFARLERVVSAAVSANTGSRRVLEKCRFQRRPRARGVGKVRVRRWSWPPTFSRGSDGRKGERNAGSAPGVKSRARDSR